MICRVSISFAVMLISITPVIADLPGPKGTRRVSPVVRFEGIDKHPDYVFFLRYQAHNGPPGFSETPSLTQVKDAKPIDLLGGRFISVYEFFALPRPDFEKRDKDDPSRKWLTEKCEGALRADMRGPITEASVFDKTDPITLYRVSIRNGKLTAEMKKETKRSEAPLDAPFNMCAFASALSLALASAGIYFARRRRL